MDEVAENAAVTCLESKSQNNRNRRRRIKRAAHRVALKEFYTVIKPNLHLSCQTNPITSSTRNRLCCQGQSARRALAAAFPGINLYGTRTQHETHFKGVPLAFLGFGVQVHNSNTFGLLRLNYGNTITQFPEL